MKTVLVPGVSGFIGHHLSKRITELLANEAYKPRMHFFEGDLPSAPTAPMLEARRHLFDACRGQVGAARALME